MIDLFLFVIIVTITSYGITQIYFNSKTFIGVRTRLTHLAGHASEHHSYLLYTIASWLLSRLFVGFIVSCAVATAAYVFTFTPQSMSTAITIIIGTAFFSVAAQDAFTDMFPTSRYPEIDYYGHFYPWHEEAEDEDFQNAPEDTDEGTLLEDGSDSSSVPQQSITVETAQEDESCEQDNTEDTGTSDESQDNSETA